MSQQPTGELSFAVAGLLAGRRPKPETVSAVTPFVLDVLCNQDPKAASAYHEALTGTVCAIAATEVAEVAARAVKALREPPCFAVCTGGASAKSGTLLDVETATALNGALAHFTHKEKWATVYEALATTAELSKYCSIPTQLLDTCIVAVKQGLAHQGVPYGDKTAVWRYAAMLAKAGGPRCTKPLCEVWVKVASCMAQRMDEPDADDMYAHDTLLSSIHGCHFGHKGEAVTSALVCAGGLPTALELLNAHGMCCVGYSSLLQTFWRLANHADDSAFAKCVTAHACIVQRLQQCTRKVWTGAFATAHERIKKLGLTWVPQDAADTLAGVRTNLADTVANLAAAVARAEKAEAEVEHLRELNATVKQGMHKVLAAHGVAPGAGGDGGSVSVGGDGGGASAKDSGTAGEQAVQTDAAAGTTRRADVVFFVGARGTGKTTLGMQLVASGEFCTLEQDGNACSWLGVVEPLLEIAASENKAVALMTQCYNPADVIAAWSNGHRVYLCSVVSDASAVDGVFADSKLKIPAIEWLRGEAVVHRSPSSSAQYPTWTFRQMWGASPWRKYLRAEHTL